LAFFTLDPEETSAAHLPEILTKHTLYPSHVHAMWQLSGLLPQFFPFTVGVGVLGYADLLV